MGRRGFLKLICAILAAAALSAAAALFYRAQSAPLSPRPRQTGKVLVENEFAAIDASNRAEGYLLVRHTGEGQAPFRAGIAKEGGTPYFYYLEGGQWETLPLTEGDGEYMVTLYEHIEGSRYRVVLRTSLAVRLRDERLPFLYPNQYVWFTPESKVVAAAETLTRRVESDTARARILYDFVVDHLTYDRELANTASPDYLPQVDEILANKTGICFDYCALLAAMLRSQGIPCRLVVGPMDELHSWVEVWLADAGPIDGAIVSPGGAWVRLDPTFASTSSDREKTSIFTSRDENYTTLRLY